MVIQQFKLVSHFIADWSPHAVNPTNKRPESPQAKTAVDTEDKNVEENVQFFNKFLNNCLINTFQNEHLL